MITRKMKSIFTFLCCALCFVCAFFAVSFSSVFNAKAEVATTETMYCDGASVRIPEDETDMQTGIRFHVRVTVSTDADGNRYVALDKDYKIAEFNALKTGVLVIPTDKLGANETLTRDGATTAYASGAKAADQDRTGAWKDKGTYLETTVYVWNIPETRYDRGFTFRGYYVDGNGENVYTANTDSRCVSYVALRAKYAYDTQEVNADGTKELNYNTYQISTLNSYLPKRAAVAAKFENVDKYLYRVGNGNEIDKSSLLDLNQVESTIAIEETIKCESDSVTLTKNAMTGKYQFAGTGVAKLTVSEKYSRNKSEITVEVIDAVNATSATSATANNVVLLNDVGLSTLTVSGGYTLYGNGFKMTATNDVLYYQFCGFVALNNGTLDNVQIIVPNCSYATLYNKQISSSENQHTYDEKSEVYGNVRSAVRTTENSTISNCYISGGRAALDVVSGSIVIENTTLYGGAVANILLPDTMKEVVLRDCTLIQEPIQATAHDTSKTLMGFSVLAICGDDGQSSPITLEGELVQYAWANEEYKTYVPSEGQGFVEKAFEKTDFLHDIDNNGANESLNLGIVYMKDGGNATAPANIIDNRTNKSNVSYEAIAVKKLYTAYVYSYTNTNGTADSFKTEPSYVPTKQSQKAVMPVVNYNVIKDGVIFETAYDETNGWSSTLTVDLDVTGDYTFSFDNLLATKFGKTLSYTVADENGKQVMDDIVLNDTGVNTYVLTITDNTGCDVNGNALDSVKHTYVITITSTKTSIAAPEQVAEVGGTPLLVVKSKDSDWSCAIPALEGTQIKYYNKTSKAYETLSLSSLTPSSTGKPNGTNNFWEYTDSNGGYKLKVTCGYIHDGKQVYGMPVVVNNGGNKMYFTISSTSGYVSTDTSGRTVTVTYDFTDANGQTLSFSKTWQFNYADYKNGTQYSYSDFVNGTLKEASSGCIVEGTLIMLANGMQKAVEELTYSDQVLVFNHYTGKMETGYIAMLDHLNTEPVLATVTNLKFSNGELLRIVWNHGVFDVTLNEYVFINENNCQDFVGHQFYSAFYANGEFVNQIITLESAFVTEEMVKIYNPTTLTHMNYFASTILNVTAAPEVVSGHVNYFELDEDMKYDEEMMQADIEKYGLYTYEDFKNLLTEEQFNALPFKYLKVSVGKGLITWDGIVAIIEYLLNNSLM